MSLNFLKESKKISIKLPKQSEIKRTELHLYFAN